MQELDWTTEMVPEAINDTPSEGKWVWVNARPVWKPAPKPKVGFQVQRKRWVVECTLAWLARFRRLS